MSKGMVFDREGRFMGYYEQKSPNYLNEHSGCVKNIIYFFAILGGLSMCATCNMYDQRYKQEQKHEHKHEQENSSKTMRPIVTSMTIDKFF
jgi:hypothetical protein